PPACRVDAYLVAGRHSAGVDGASDDLIVAVAVLIGLPHHDGSTIRCHGDLDGGLLSVSDLVDSNLATEGGTRSVEAAGENVVVAVALAAVLPDGDPSDR